MKITFRKGKKAHFTDLGIKKDVYVDGVLTAHIQSSRQGFYWYVVGSKFIHYNTLWRKEKASFHSLEEAEHDVKDWLENPTNASS